MHTNISDELRRIFSEEADKKIYVIIEDVDAALDSTHSETAEKLREAIIPVFQSFSPVLKDQAFNGRLKMIFTAHTPSVALSNTYPGSPFNFGKEHIFERFDLETCVELANAAGLSTTKEVDLLFKQTGGHRSLVWAILGVVVEHPTQATPALNDPISITAVYDTLQALRAESNVRPELSAALTAVRMGRHPGAEATQHLRDAMLIASDGWQLSSVLLQNFFADADAPANGV
jgi:hypothetical protein